MSASPAIRGHSSSTTIDAVRWPDVASTPDSPVRAAIARRLFRRAARRMPVQVIESGGPKVYGRGGPASPAFRINRPEVFFERLGAGGTIGFGEAYMAGDWSSDELAGALTAFASNVRELVPPIFHRLRHAVLSRQPHTEDNTIHGARQNIHRHYDLSNDLFKLFLDDSLTYSSALYSGDPADTNDDLVTAQRRKIDRLLDSAGVSDGTRLLEIGTGWGELSMRAARRGAQVTSITISAEQAELARERIDQAGLSGRARVLLQDYRETSGEFDAVVSVEMIEAVGANHWADYFGSIDRLLVPRGRFGLQAITQEDRAVQASKDTYTWIRKYIFPGGQLPSVESIAQTVAKHTSLRIADRYMFGRHYAETLRRWRVRFDEQAARVEALGFDETFRRMWRLYLAYSEAGFRSGYLDVGQFTLIKSA